MGSQRTWKFTHARPREAIGKHVWVNGLDLTVTERQFAIACDSDQHRSIYELTHHFTSKSPPMTRAGAPPVPNDGLDWSATIFSPPPTGGITYHPDDAASVAKGWYNAGAKRFP